jgi:Protein of unknown function (DUF3738)
MDGSTTLGVLFGLGLGAASCLVVVVNGQTPAPSKAPAFEVASINENVSASDNASVRAQPGGRRGAPGPDGTAPRAATSTDGVSLVTTIHEPLGLKLDAQPGPVEVLVIESAQRPVDD